MKDAAVKPDSFTYCALLDACGKVAGRPALADEWSRKEVTQRLMAIEKDMAQSGVQHTASSVTALVWFSLQLLSHKGGLYWSVLFISISFFD